MDKRLVREPEAREILGGISHGAFHGLRRDGRIPALKLGRATYYDISDLHEFVERLREELFGGPEVAR